MDQPSGEIFDSMLDGAVDEYEARERERYSWYVRLGRVILGLLLFLPRLLDVLLIARLRRMMRRLR